MCRPAPALLRLEDDTYAHHGGGTLGMVGDQAHAVRRSSHNCAPMQESGPFHPNYVHAWDWRVDDRDLFFDAWPTLAKDRRIHYAIHRSRLYYPDHRGGGSRAYYGSNPHNTHAHLVVSPGAHGDTRPFYGRPEPRKATPAEERDIRRMAKEGATGRRHLKVKARRMRGRDVRDAQNAIGPMVRAPRTGVYGHGTARSVRRFQRTMNKLGQPVRVTGTVDRRTWELVLTLNLARFFGVYF